MTSSGSPCGWFSVRPLMFLSAVHLRSASCCQAGAQAGTTCILLLDFTPVCHASAAFFLSLFYVYAVV